MNKTKISVFGHGNLDRAICREDDIVPVCIQKDLRLSAKEYFRHSTFADASNFTSFTAKDIPHPTGKRIY